MHSMLTHLFSRVLSSGEIQTVSRSPLQYKAVILSPRVLHLTGYSADVSVGETILRW